MGHHLNDYPRHRFLSEAYQPAKKDNSTAYYPVMLAAPIVTALILNDYRWRILALGVLSSALILKVCVFPVF
jgi:hypothetical protein